MENAFLYPEELIRTKNLDLIMQKDSQIIIRHKSFQNYLQIKKVRGKNRVALAVELRIYPVSCEPHGFEVFFKAFSILVYESYMLL